MQLYGLLLLVYLLEVQAWYTSFVLVVQAGAVVEHVWFLSDWLFRLSEDVAGQRVKKLLLGAR